MEKRKFRIPVFVATDTAQGLSRLYDAASAKWQATIERLGYPAAYAELTVAALNDHRRRKLAVLDVGTGTGAFSSAFGNAGFAMDRLDLLDPSKDMLEIATNRLRGIARKVTPVAGCIGSRDIPAQTYDVVLCAHVIEHVADPVAALAWFRDRMNGDGCLLLVVSKPHWCTALIRLRWGHRAYRVGEVRAMLTAAGFRRIDAIPFSKGPPGRTSCGYIAQP